MPESRALTKIAGSACFPRQSRLLAASQFQRVFRQGRRIGDRHFQLVVSPRSSEDAVDAEARLGLAVAKRAVRRASERNRIKRIARECFRHMRTELAGIDLVLLVRPGVDSLASSDMHSALNTLLVRAQALKPGDVGGTLAPVPAAVTSESGAASP